MKHGMNKGLAMAKKNKAVKLVRKHPGKAGLAAAGVAAGG
jgi:2-oxo-4-hydroxy-4-carboxy--5-ureidoimidazoline (OHCU) decarboxylase